MVPTTRQSFFGSMMTTAPCPRCRGRGQEVTRACGRCSGNGVHSQIHSLKVEIPAGVADGNRLRLRAGGQVGAITVEELIATACALIDARADGYGFEGG